jgi:hypothetical protein
MHGEITMSQSEDTKMSTHQSVLAEVADVLKASPEVVRSRVKQVLVEREVAKRVDMLDKGLAKLREAKGEVNKIRPPVSFTPDGIKVEGNFSKADFETLKKVKEKVAKLEGALEKAFAGQEFDKLSSLIGGKEVVADSSDGE